MDITWSTEKNVNYDSCTESIRKNSQDNEDTTPPRHKYSVRVTHCGVTMVNCKEYVSNIDCSDLNLKCELNDK